MPQKEDKVTKTHPLVQEIAHCFEKAFNICWLAFDFENEVKVIKNIQLLGLQKVYLCKLGVNQANRLTIYISFLVKISRLSSPVTLKLWSRSPKSDQPLNLLQLYLYTSLAKFHPFVHEILWVQ